MNRFRRFIGTKEFYRTVVALALPLLLQNAVSTFVNLLDNLMVGRIGTESMSGVSIVNQLLFVFNLCLFGGTGGAGIFGAQFYGKGDHRGLRHTLRFNLVLVLGFTAAAVGALLLWKDVFIGAFLHESGSGGDLARTLSEGRDYLRLMLPGLPAFALTTAYVSIIRVTGDNRLPMRASLTAIAVNLAGNYILIYGKLGAPALGVRGAAIATVLSRYVELSLILLGTHGRKDPPEYIRGLYRDFSVPAALARDILRRGAPLLGNELLWSLGMTMLTQCYSYRGLDAVAALNITNTVANLFNTVFFTMGNVVGVIIGNMLGAEEYRRAKAAVPQLMALAFCACGCVGLVFFFLAPLAPRLYNTEPEIMALAASLMRINACMMPLIGIVNCSYWTIRAGGRTFLTMLSDSAFTWVISVPVAWVSIHALGLSLPGAYLAVNLADTLKLVMGVILIRKGIWIQNLVGGAGPEKGEV